MQTEEVLLHEELVSSVNSLHPSIVFSHTIFGDLYIRSYRVFKRMRTCVILMTMDYPHSRYLYQRFVSNFAPNDMCNAFCDIDFCINYINQMKQCSQTVFIVALCFTNIKGVKQLNPEEYERLKIIVNNKITNDKKINNEVIQKNKNDKMLNQEIINNEIISKEVIDLQGEQPIQKQDCLKIQVNKNMVYLQKFEKDQELSYMDSSMVKKMKQVIYHYIDTFGLRHETAYYHESKQSSLNIDTLLNTISYIIYQELKGKQFTQIQSSNWTVYEHSKQDKMTSDRKDIMLTGNGSVLLLNILLFDKLQPYLAQCYKQIKEVLRQCSFNYSKSQFKVYRISNCLHPSKIIYQYQMQSVE